MRAHCLGYLLPVLTLATSGLLVTTLPAQAAPAHPASAADAGRTQSVQVPASAFSADATVGMQERAHLVGVRMDRLRRSGGAVAMSADGRTVAVAAVPLVSRGVAGRVYVFSGSGADWQLEATLRPPIPARGTPTKWGASVAMSADGRHVAVGDPVAPGRALLVGPSTTAGPGAVDTFARVGTTWSRGLRVYPAGTNAGYFGKSVALSGDGHRLLVADPGPDVFDAPPRGQVWAFAADATRGYEDPRALPMPADIAEGPQWTFGDQVGVSADGETAVVGSYCDCEESYEAGRAHAFVSDAAGNWHLSHEFVAEHGDVGDTGFGQGQVTISADGETVAIGSVGSWGPTGTGEYTVPASITIFDHTGTGWVRRAVVSVANGQAGSCCFGGSVALSGDGDTLLAGVDSRTGTSPAVTGAGGADRFVRTATGWHWGGVVNPTAPRVDERAGLAVALSQHGGTAVLGAPFYSSPANAPLSGAYVFTASSTEPVDGSLFAVVSDNGTLIRGSSGATAAHYGPGSYVVRFPRPLWGCAVVANMGYAGPGEVFTFQSVVTAKVGAHGTVSVIVTYPGDTVAGQYPSTPVRRDKSFQLHVDCGQGVDAVVAADGTWVSGTYGLTSERLGTGRYQMSTFPYDLAGCAPVATVGITAAGRPSTTQAFLAMGVGGDSITVSTRDATLHPVDAPFDLIITCTGARTGLFPASPWIDQLVVPDANRCAFTSSFVNFTPGGEPTDQGFVSTWASSATTGTVLLKNGGYGVREDGAGVDIVATC